MDLSGNVKFYDTSSPELEGSEKFLNTGEYGRVGYEKQGGQPGQQPDKRPVAEIPFHFGLPGEEAADEVDDKGNGECGSEQFCPGIGG